MPEKDYKKDFPWFANNKDLVYLDNAATTLKPKSMIEAERYYYTHLSANPHSDNKLATEVYSQIQQTRNLLAKYIHADPQEVMFTSGATESINVVANAMYDYIQEDDEIILTYLEHAANLLPWYRLRELKKAKIVFASKTSVKLTAKDIVQLLTPKTKIVAFTAANNLLAIDYDIQNIVQAIKEYNSDIYVCVDATQYIEHFELNCHQVNCDFAVGSGHKMCGPTGCGFLYIKKPLFNIMNPLRYGGDMNEEIYEDHFTFAQGNHKFEGGTPNAAGLYAWKASLEYLLNLGYEEMRNKELMLKQYFLTNKPIRSDLIIFNPEAKTPLITFGFKKNNDEWVDTQLIEKYLASKNILVRSGLSEAELIPNPLHVKSVVRASMLFYNDVQDLNRLIQALNEFTY